MSNSSPAEDKTEGDYLISDVRSALQKEIRRGKEREAMFWAIEFETFSYPQLWQRLEIIASEDVGLANPMIPVTIRTLKDQYFEAAEKRNSGYRLFLANAILQLCRSKKSRAVDDFVSEVYFEHSEGKKIPVPDYAKFGHSVKASTPAESERLYDEKFKIENESLEIENPYKNGAKTNTITKNGLPNKFPKKGRSKVESEEQDEKPKAQGGMDKFVNK